MTAGIGPRLAGRRMLGRIGDGSLRRRSLVAASVLSCALLITSCSSTTDSADTGDTAASSSSSGATERESASAAGSTAVSASTAASTSDPVAADPLPSDPSTPDAGSESPTAPAVGTGELPADEPAPATDQPSAVAPQPPSVVAAPTLAPGQGNIAIEIPEIPVTTQAAVPMTSSASFAGAVTASVASVRSITAEPIGPGEIGGPAIAVTVEIVNGSANPVDLDTVYVTLNDSTDSPGILTTGNPASPLAGPLPAGGRAQGVYVFTVAESLRDPVTVLVGYSAAAEVVSFVGNVA